MWPPCLRWGWIWRRKCHWWLRSFGQRWEFVYVWILCSLFWSVHLRCLVKLYCGLTDLIPLRTSALSLGWVSITRRIGKEWWKCQNSEKKTIAFAFAKCAVLAPTTWWMHAQFTFLRTFKRFTSHRDRNQARWQLFCLKVAPYRKTFSRFCSFHCVCLHPWMKKNTEWGLKTTQTRSHVNRSHIKGQIKLNLSVRMILLLCGDEIYILIETNFEWKFDKRTRMWPSCYLNNGLILYCGFIIWFSFFTREPEFGFCW